MEELAPMLKGMLVGEEGKGEDTNLAKPREKSCEMWNLLYKANFVSQLLPTMKNEAFGHFLPRILDISQLC